jgi:hypothetical protein
VWPEFAKSQHALGGEAEVERFVRRALQRLNAPLDEKKGEAPLHALPRTLKERAEAIYLPERLRIDFQNPPRNGAQFVHRAHPLKSLLADAVVESALDDAGDGPSRLAARAGAIFTRDVEFMSFMRAAFRSGIR